jgi:hypothetical protein
MDIASYDPFAPGRFPVEVRTIRAPAGGDIPVHAPGQPRVRRRRAGPFVRGLTLAHLDAVLVRDRAAHRFLAGDVVAELATRGVEAVAHLR